MPGMYLFVQFCRQLPKILLFPSLDKFIHINLVYKNSRPCRRPECVRENAFILSL